MHVVGESDKAIGGVVLELHITGLTFDERFDCGICGISDGDIDPAQALWRAYQPKSVQGSIHGVHVGAQL